MFGCPPYAGNAARCYRDTFKMQSGEENLALFKAQELLAQEHIKNYLEELEALAAEDANSAKNFIASNLKKIIEEASSAEYRDRFGTLLSPAPLRSVAVSAAKALMELYPIKERGGNNSNNNGESDTNITFNVIVPGQTNDKE